MPIMWVISFLMPLLFIIILIMMYYYKSIYVKDNEKTHELSYYMMW